MELPNGWINTTTSRYPDPNGADYASLGIGAVNILIIFSLMIYALFHRDYLPIKAKQIWVEFASFISILLLWFGVAVSNIVIPRMYVFTVTCSIWLLWLQDLGTFGFFSCLIFRYYRLYRIILENKAFWTHQWLVFCVIYAPGVLLTIILQATHQITFDSDPLELSCIDSLPSQASFFTLILVYLVVMLYFTWALRNIRKSFNEYKENRLAMISFIITYIIEVIITLGGFNDYIWGRVISQFVLLITFNGWFFPILGRAIFGCMFQREAYLKKFQLQLRIDVSSSSSGMEKNPSKDFRVGVEKDTTKIHLEVRDEHGDLSASKAIEELSSIGNDYE